MFRSKPLRIAVAAVLVAVVAVLDTGIATAGVIVPSPTPVPYPGGGGTGGGGSAGYRITCDRATGRGVQQVLINGRWTAQPGNVIVNHRWSGCINSQWTPDTANCPIGWEVWRFYGTLQDPTASESVSRAYMNSRTCQTGYAYLESPNLEDDPNTPQGGTTPMKPQIVWDDVNGFVGRSQPIPALGNAQAYMTLAPFRRIGSACTAFSTVGQPGTDFVQRMLNAGGDLYNVPGAYTLRSTFAAKYRAVRDLFGATSANALFNVSGGNPAAGTPVIGDSYRCGSPQDFAVVKTVSQLNATPNRNFADRRIMGSCWLPVTRMMHRYNWLGASVYDVYLRPYYGGADEAYAPSTPNPFEGGGNASLNSAGQNAFTAYRAAIADEIRTRVAGAAGTPGATPTLSPNAFGLPPSQRAWLAGYSAQCQASFGDVYPTPDAAPQPQIGTLPGDAVELIVNTPEVGQAGGSNRAPAEVTTRAGNVLCGTTPCTGAILPRIFSISPALSVVDPDVADARTASGGTYRPVTDCFTNPSRCGVGTWGLEFLKATPNRDEVTIAGAGSAVIYANVGGTSTYTVCFPGDYGVPCTSQTTSVSQLVSKTVPLVFRYQPDDSFPVVSATPTPLSDRNND